MATVPSWPALKQGNSGKNVSALQSLLNYRNNNNAILLDATFGTSTYNAVVAFQKANNLTSDGIAGSGTLSKLVATVSSSTTVSNASRAAQHLLSKFESLMIDGTFDTDSVSAAKTFQQKMGLSPVDGIIGSTTWQYLFGYDTYPSNGTSSYGQPLTDVSQFKGRDSVDLLARLIYGEATENAQEQAGVAYVAYNRKASGSWGSTYESVILAPGQFDSMLTNGQTLAPVLTSSKWKSALAIAQNLSAYTNPIGSRLYFWAKSTYASSGSSHKNPITIGGTTFFDW